MIADRQEPGKYLPITSVFAGSGPHSQLDTAAPTVGATGAVAELEGCRTIELPSIAVLIPVTFTWISPAELVLIDVTYLET